MRVRFEYRKVVVDVAEMEQLRTLGKEVMSASVDAELFGLTTVCSYLSMAFDEIVRTVVELNAEAGTVEAVESLVESERGVSGY